MAYSVRIIDSHSKSMIASQQISGDAGQLQRRQLADRLVKKHSDPRDCYVVETDLTDGAVVDTYELV